MESIETQGIRIPRLGLGTFRMPAQDCRTAVESALSLGYCHLDTAEMYENEAAVGDAIAASGIARKKLHVTTKVWHEHLKPDALRRAFDTSLSKLKLDFVDLYLLHWPSRDMNIGATLNAMMKLREEKLVRAVGVANFNLHLLKEAVETVDIPIACNQIEYHVFLDQTPMLQYLRSKAIPLVAYAPLAQGRAAEHAALKAIGTKHNATAAQIALAWLLDQHGVAAIPKAQRATSQQSNLEASNIKLDDDDHRAIAALPKDQRYVNPPFAPTWDV
ncbi:MAG: aldo/keto reductase [Pseudonocardiaceae bacterium]|nr:MAG: aldo/keto reductase [Pseudonocardiaceae bacterium]